MIVSDIKRQSKHANRYSIYVDGAYSFSLEELELSGSSLRVGSELSEDEVNDWRARSSSSKSYDAALRYLSYRQRSRVEMERYLVGKDYDPQTVAATLERLIELGLIDDEAFARAWIADRNRLRPRSRIALQAELMAKGIARETIDQILSETSRDEEITILARVIEQKRSRYDSQEKLMAYLATKGYSYDLIKEALEQEA